MNHDATHRPPGPIRMISSSHRAAVHGGFECSDDPGPERIPATRQTRRPRRPERDTVRDLDAPAR